MRVKTEERRQNILEMAKETFIENGFEQTSMAAIAKKVGGSKATLYNYFSSKEEIFVAVMESVAKREIAHAFEQFVVEGNIRQSLLDAGFKYLKFIYKPDTLATRRMVMAEATRSDIGQCFYSNGPQKGWGQVSQNFERLMENGQMQASDPWVAARQLKALLEAELTERYELGVETKSDDDHLRQVVTRAIDSFLILYPIE